MAKSIDSCSARQRAADARGVLSRFLLLLALLTATAGCLRSLTDPFAKKELPVVEQKSVPGEDPKTLLAEVETALRMAEASTTGGLPKPIDGWYRKVDIDLATPTLPQEYRWQHDALAEYLKESPGDKKGLKLALRSSDKFVAATAAIALARLEPKSPVAPLVKVIRSRELPTSVRCAAVETLAREQAIENEGQLRTLVEQYGPSRDGKLPNSQLYAELLAGLARHVDIGNEPLYAEALALHDLDVQTTVLALYAHAKEPMVPNEVRQLASSPNARLRVGALRVLVASGDGAVWKDLERSLQDQDLTVRLEAIALLGQLDQRESLNLLYERLDDPLEVHRAAAAKALVARREWAGVERAARDKSFRVRQEVAIGLREHASRERVELATALIGDVSSNVQESMAQSLVAWPEELAGPLLLEALGSPNRLPRVAAAKSLSTQWPIAKDFNPDAKLAERTPALAALKERWRREHPHSEVVAIKTAGKTTITLTAGELNEYERLLKRFQNPPGSSERWLAQKQLEERRRNLIPAIEQLVAAKRIKLDDAIYRELLPGASSLMATVEKLRTPDVNARRAAARSLATEGAKEPLNKLALGRIEELSAAERDPLTFIDVLRAAGTNPDYVAHDLALAALAHEEADVRRRGCEYLARCGNARQASALIKCLHDEDLVVRKNAILALERCGPADEREQLYAFLVNNDVYLQVAAAKTLSRWNDDRGAAALERLALADHPTTRRLAVMAMGELASDAFLPALMEALEDEPAVRLAALAALPKVTQQDVLAKQAPPPVSAEAKVKVWQDWYEQQPR